MRAFFLERSLLVPSCRAVFAIYLIGSVPFRLAFCPKFTFDPEFQWFVTIDLLCTIFFSFETFQLLSRWGGTSIASSILPTAYEPTEQQKLDGLGNSRLNCRQKDTRRAWYKVLLFFVSTAPLEYLAMLFSRLDLVNYVMLNRLLLLFFLPKYVGIVTRSYIKSSGVRRTWLLFFTMGMAAHLCACGFYYVAFNEATNGVTMTWPEAAGLYVVDNTTSPPILTKTTSAFETYITSLYWACVTMITTGFGDIVPLHISETVWCLFSMFVGVIITALTIANIQILVTSVDAPRLNYQRKMEMIKKCMGYRNLPNGLQERVLAFYDYQWAILKGSNESEFLRELPQILQQQVTNFMCRDIIASLPILRKANKALLNALVECSEMNTYSPKDCIIQRGERCNGAFLVSHGEVEVLKENVVERKMKRLDRFAEECLFIDKVSTHTVRSKGFCEIVLLPRVEFQRILASQCDEDHISQMRTTATALSQNSSKSKANKMFGSAEEFKPTGFQRHFHPSSLFRKIWDCLVLIGLICYTFSIPLSFFYIVENTPFRDTPRLLTLGYLIDLFFCVDTIFQWNYFMYLDEGLIVYDTNHIRERYYRERNCSRELCALIPFDVISSFLGGKYCHYFRLVKILRLPNISLYKDSTVDAVLNELNIVVDLVLYRVFKLNLFMVVVSHWVGCLWFMIGSLSKRFEYNENWLDADESNELLSISHSDYGGFSVYLRSVYFAVVGMSTIGYGDIVPTNVLETSYTTVVILFGGLLLPAIVGGLAAYVSSFHKTEKLFHKRITKVRQYLLKINVKETVLSKCRSYFDYHWYYQGGVIEQEVSDELPTSLSVEVAFQINGAKLSSIPFLRCCDKATKLLLATVLQPRVFIPSECVVREGERGSVMYIVQKGVLEVSCSQVNGSIRILSDGDYFGESCLLSSKTNRATVTAVEYCDCFTLNRDDFNEVVDGSPAVQAIKVNLANSIMESQASNKRAFRNISRYSKCRVLMLGANFDTRIQKNHQKLLPDSPMVIAWNLFLLGICLYNVWIIPFRLAFSHARESIYIDYSFDALFVLDMILNYQFVAFFHNGELVMDTQKIRQNYTLTRFKVDFVSSFPFDLVALIILTNKTDWAATVQDGFRLLKLLRLRRHFGTLDKIFSILTDHHITLAPLRLAEFLSGVILIAHIAACGFFTFARWKSSSVDCTAGSEDCWEGTWIMRQIYNDKLPQDGGSVWQLYVRSLNWALPTLVVVVIGDVVPTTSPETLYALLWMLVGVTINASIVGNVANIVANLETDSSDFANSIDNIRKFLSVHHLSHDFHDRVNDFARYLWMAHSGTVSEDDFILRLPHMLQTQIIEDTRMRYIIACPFFHSLQKDVVETLALSMKQLLFCVGDVIIHTGDMGAEMYFLDRGTVSVVSSDHNTTYATLSQRGAFFGETCLFFKKPRLTSVVAQTCCDVFQLKKEDLFDELERRDIDLAQMRELFFGIHTENERRNKAIERNLIRCKEPNSKLSKILDRDDEASTDKLVPKIFLPGTTFRFTWDIFTTFSILYFAFSVLYQIAFRSIDDEEDAISGVWFEIWLDIFFIIDCYILRSTQFAFMENGVVYQSKADIMRFYRKNGMVADVISSLASLSVMFPSYHFRLLSLVRVTRLPYFLDSVYHHLDERGIRISLASNLLSKIILLYIIACHQISCIWFIIHRYIERGREFTWATSDCPLGGKYGSDTCLAAWNDASEQHNVCNMNSMIDCYIRAVHFSLTTLSTCGYGDISPATELETVWELCVVLVSGCFLAALIGAFCIFLQQSDTTGQNSFYTKIERVKQYMRFRNIPRDIQKSILFYHQCRWEASQTLDERKTLSILPQPLQLDISFAVKQRIIHMVPILDSLPIIVQKRIAHALMPQVYAPRDNPIVYNVGDIGWDLFFISSGFVSISLPDDATELDLEGREGWMSNKIKFDSTGLVLGPGNHVGEYCLCSNSGVRQETVIAATKVEIYALGRENFEDICALMPPSKAKTLRKSLLSKVVQSDYDICPNQSLHDEAHDDMFRRRKKQLSAPKRITFSFPSIPSDSDRSTTIKRRRFSVPGYSDSDL